MPRTREQIAKAAEEAEAWLDQLDPTVTPAEDAADLREIAAAMTAASGADVRLRQAVDAARSNGKSWAAIGAVLGVSRQAAQERFGQPAHR